MPSDIMPDVPPVVQLSTPLPSTITRHLNKALRLPEVQRHGFTHPAQGHFLMLPPEFDLILAHEPKEIAQVLLEVIRQTSGWIGDGPGNRRLWVKLTYGHFARKGLLSRANAQRALNTAVERGYVRRRLVRDRTYEYAVHWQGVEYD
jgi:hypothetical protein